MIDHWLETLEKLAVSAIDRETVDAFRKNPSGRIFLSVADIFSKYHRDEDAVQLLIYGVRLHPGYTAARVVLAQRLFEQSVFNEAWQILEESPISLRDNKSAQILRFRLSLLLGYAEKLKTIKEEMKGAGHLEGAIFRLAEELEMKSFDNVRLSFLQIAKAEGFHVDNLELPTGVTAEQLEVSPAGDSEEEDAGDDPVLIERLIDGFYVAPIGEIFNKVDGEELPPEEDHHNLDAVTLAQVYRKQARYQKALDIYQKLLYMAPNNDLYKKQVEELGALRDEQRDREKNFDPELVERLDQVQEIEKKIGILNRLLSRLDQYEAG